MKQTKQYIINTLLSLMLTLFSMAQGHSQNNFKVKGFFVDLRNEVMTIKALKDLAKELSEFGLNTLFVEWEATFPYKNNAVITNSLSYTRGEIKSFVEYCNQIGIDVIPVQQCFGHVEYILRHDRYRSLSEDNKDISQVCPLKTQEDSLLFADLFADQVSLTTSKYIHIGGDETRLLGHCEKCSRKAAELGTSKLFVDYMRMMCNIALKLGKTPVIWSDMLLKHPEAADELPKETILIDWNYGWKINHFGNVDELQKKGFTIWGAPSIRSHPDNWYVTDWQTHFNNQRDFIPYARSANYNGMIMTSWSTSGVYSFIWDVGNTILDMEPIRNNYPLSGFHILIASYIRALKEKMPLDPQSFVVSYAGERFGLSRKDGEKLWQVFMATPELITNGKPEKSSSIEAMKMENDKAIMILSVLQPVKNKTEFEHFRLMADLRKYYLDYKEIVSVYNSKNFTINQSKPLLAKLELLKKNSVTLDKKFSELNRGFLKDAEIEKQNKIRNQPVTALYSRIVNLNENSN